MNAPTHTLRACVLCFCVALPLHAQAQDPPITLSFNNAPLHTAATLFANLSKTPIILDHRIRSLPFTLHNTRPLSKTEALTLLRNAFQQHHLELEQRGAYTVIQPTPPTTPRTQTLTRSSSSHTVLFTPQHAPILPLQTLAQQLASPNAHISIHPHTQSLIITEHPASLPRLLKALRALDTDTQHERFYLYTPKHRSASSLKDTLSPLTNP